MHLLKAIFDVCDALCAEHGVTRIKTIGDSYLAVAGVPEPLDVNTASRMESNGIPGTVNIADAMAALLSNDAAFSLESRGTMDVKGKGAMELYTLQKA